MTASEAIERGQRAVDMCPWGISNLAICPLGQASEFEEHDRLHLTASVAAWGRDLAGQAWDAGVDAASDAMTAPADRAATVAELCGEGA